MSALDKQEGGSHYKDYPIQPVEFITKNKLGFLEGCVVKRVCRWRAKNGIEDLRKAIHELELLIELEGPAEDYCSIVRPCTCADAPAMGFADCECPADAPHRQLAHGGPAG